MPQTEATERCLADCHQRLIHAATEAFMTEGYRASVDRIALRAGVARQTLYNHFESKEALFNEVVRLAAADFLVALEDNSRGLRDSLLRFGALYSAKILSRDGLAHYRVMIAEATRFPNLARSYFAMGPQRTVARLAEFIAAAMERGELRRDDPPAAAELLIGMLGGFKRTRDLLAPEPDTDEHEQARIVKVVECFLRAYASERTLR
jgi:TetR/AcrR family transcriptional repressor of mexJK operon